MSVYKWLSWSLFAYLFSLPIRTGGAHIKREIRFLFEEIVLFIHFASFSFSSRPFSKFNSMLGTRKKFNASTCSILNVRNLLHKAPSGTAHVIFHSLFRCEYVKTISLITFRPIGKVFSTQSWNVNPRLGSTISEHGFKSICIRNIRISSKIKSEFSHKHPSIRNIVS